MDKHSKLVEVAIRCAGASVETRSNRAWVKLNLASLSRERRLTGALKIVHLVNTSALITTRRVFAVVNVDLTVVSRESGGTEASILANALLKTLAPMLTRVGVALVHLLLTCRPSITLRAVADIS